MPANIPTPRECICCDYINGALEPVPNPDCPIHGGGFVRLDRPPIPTPECDACANAIGKSGIDWHFSATRMLIKAQQLDRRLAVAVEALESIKKNTCCQNCQEAAKWAKAALARIEAMKEGSSHDRNSGEDVL